MNRYFTYAETLRTIKEDKNNTALIQRFVNQLKDDMREALVQRDFHTYNIASELYEKYNAHLKEQMTELQQKTQMEQTAQLNSLIGGNHETATRLLQPQA